MIVVDVLRAVPLFEELSEVALASLAEVCGERGVAAGEAVFNQGDAADAMFVVAEGEVAIARDAAGGSEPLRTRGAGDYFGEIGLLGDGPRSVTARASRDSVLLVVPKTEILRFLVAYPTLAFRLRIETVRRHGENAAAALELGRRADLRVRVDRPVWVHLADGRRIEARLENLSIGGLCLSGAPEAWRTHEQVQFRLGLPGAEPLLDVHGRVAWREGRALGVVFRVDSADHDRRIQRALGELLPR